MIDDYDHYKACRGRILVKSNGYTEKHWTYPLGAETYTEGVGIDAQVLDVSEETLDVPNEHKTYRERMRPPFRYSERALFVKIPEIHRFASIVEKAIEPVVRRCLGAMLPRGSGPPATRKR
jgi:hypothetical protein